VNLFTQNPALKDSFSGRKYTKLMFVQDTWKYPPAAFSC